MGFGRADGLRKRKSRTWSGVDMEGIYAEREALTENEAQFCS